MKGPGNYFFKFSFCVLTVLLFQRVFPVRPGFSISLPMKNLWGIAEASFLTGWMPFLFERKWTVLENSVVMSV